MRRSPETKLPREYFGVSGIKFGNSAQHEGYSLNASTIRKVQAEVSKIIWLKEGEISENELYELERKEMEKRLIKLTGAKPVIIIAPDFAYIPDLTIPVREYKLSPRGLLSNIVRVHHSFTNLREGDVKLGLRDFIGVGEIQELPKLPDGTFVRINSEDENRVQILIS